MKSIQGVTRIWFEEATEGTAEDFRQLDLRLRGKDNLQFTFTYNPIDIEHPLKELYHDSGIDNITILKTTFLDNKFIDENYRNVLEKLKNEDENYYRIYALGEWGQQVSGLIFPNFKTIKTLPDLYDWRCLGLDFGFTNDPTALIDVRKIGDRLVCGQVIYQTGLTVNDLIRELNTQKIDKNTEIVADSSQPATIAELRRAGFNVMPCEKGKGSIQAGIDMIKRFELCFTADSDGLKKEAKNYKWKEHRATGKTLNEPVDMFNHGFDAIRYAVMFKNSGNKKVLKWGIL